jgi:D-methionine transport system ATP-binding protein
MQVIKQICDRAAVLDNGELIEEAPVIELFTRPKTVVAKSFTQSAMHLELPDSIKAQLKPEAGPELSPLVRLAFVGEQTSEPLIASLIKRFSVIANILQANMDIVHGATVGIALCQMLGENQSVQQSLNFLSQQGVQVEVLGYVPTHITTTA